MNRWISLAPALLTTVACKATPKDPGTPTTPVVVTATDAVPVDAAPEVAAAPDARTVDPHAVEWFHNKTVVDEPAFAGVIELVIDHGKPVQPEDNAHDSTVQFASDKAKKGVVVDLVDCGGWVGRGKLTKELEMGWRVAVVAAAAKLDMTLPCRAQDHWRAFAIAPANKRRATLVTTPADPVSVLAGLPPEIVAWHDDMIAYYPTTPIAPEVWADLDADGGIDLVEIGGRCKEDDYTCTVVLLFDQGRWLVIGVSTPA